MTTAKDSTPNSVTPGPHGNRRGGEGNPFLAPDGIYINYACIYVVGMGSSRGPCIATVSVVCTDLVRHETEAAVSTPAS